MKPVYEKIKRIVDNNLGEISLNILNKKLFSEFENNNYFKNGEIFLKEILHGL